MKKLIQAGLFGDGLYEVKLPGQVKRYNECLEAMGMETTDLKRFSIDGLGHSPEIAAEKKDDYYLSHGPANSFFVIISPDQYNKPPYAPSHSFDRALMKTIFESSHEAIEEITKDTAIWIEVDQGIDVYTKPTDLLLLDSVRLKFHSTNGVMESSSRLHNLIRKFRTIDTRLSTVTDNWSDKNLRNEIKNISKQYGDLRYRIMKIDDINYHNVSSFYTRDFGGVTIMRNQGIAPMMVIHDDSDSHVSEYKKHHNIFDIQDDELLETLEGLKLIEVDHQVYYQQDNERLDRMFLFHFAMAYSKLGKTDYDILEVLDKKVLYQKYLEQVVNKGLLTDDVLSLNGVENILFKKKSVSSSDVSKNLYGMLLHPREGLDSSKKSLLWNILTHKYPEDFMSLYSYNKNRFIDLYKSWPKCVKKFVVDYLTSHYEPWFKQNIKI